MKQTLQLRLGQHLTMTPQLQQAIRLLQLSALDLSQEVQEALETNPLLESEEEFRHAQEANGGEQPKEQADGNNSALTSNDINNEREIQTDASSLSEDLPVDSEWNDVYDSYLPNNTQLGEGPDTEFLLERGDVQSLHDHLMWQLNLTPFSPLDNAIANNLIDSINEDGYFTGNLEDVLLSFSADDELTLEDVEAVLHRLQAFDPPGVGARDPQECLLIQLYQLPEDIPYRDKAIELCRHHFKLLANQDQAQLKRQLKIDDTVLASINRLIRSLNPRPGTLIASPEPQYVVPDVFVSKRNGRWHVELNGEATPKLRVNNEYANLIRRADQSDDNTFLKNHLQEARWFIKSLMSRNETILRVASKIVEYQRCYF